MHLLYALFIELLALAMRLGAKFNPKVRKSWLGRQEAYAKAEKYLKNQPVLWMHAASLGEYEQGLPVLEALKREYPQYKVLITFFSPSGYEVVAKKANVIADCLCYLPLDRKAEVKRFTALFKTQIFFTVKYDYWYHLLAELKNQGARLYVISALFYPRQMFFKIYGKWFKNQLKQHITTFFHQTEASCQLAKSIGLSQSIVSGDTRYDRVKQNKAEWQDIPHISSFKNSQSLLIFGSSWETEERIAESIALRHPEAKIILAPHNIRREISLSNQLNVLRWSEISNSNEEMLNETLKNAQILIIDQIGLLSKLYAYGDIAIVGGGFHSAGLHNILEAATFGKPVLYGHHYKKNPEADALIAFGGAKSFPDDVQMVEFISHLLKYPEKRIDMGKKSQEFIQTQPNATEIVMKNLLNLSNPQ